MASASVLADPPAPHFGPAPARPSADRALTLLTSALWLIILCLHLGFLNLHSLWNNEFITIISIKLPWAAMIAERVQHNHMPGYFLMLKAWTGLAGTGERALHLPSAVLSLCGIFCVWMLARELFGARWGILALAVAGLNQTNFELSNDARMYSWLYFSSAATLWALIHYLEHGRRRALIAMAAAGLFGLAAHLLYLLASAGILIFILITWRRWPRPRIQPAQVLAATLAPVALTIPLIVWWSRVENKLGGLKSWGPLKFTNGYRMVLDLMLGDLNYGGRPNRWNKVAGGILIVMLLLLLAPAVQSWWRRLRNRPAADAAPDGAPRRPLPGRQMLLLAIWTLLPMIAIVVADAHSKSRMSGAWRYYVTTGPAAVLLLIAATRNLRVVAPGSPAARRPSAGALAAAAFAITILFVDARGTLAYMRSPGSGIREALAILKKEMRPGDAVVASQDKNRTEAFLYYGMMEQYPPEKPDSVRTPDQVIAWLKPIIAGHQRLWVVYYKKEAKDDILPAIKLHPEMFTPIGKMRSWVDNAVGLYEIKSGAKKEDD